MMLAIAYASIMAMLGWRDGDPDWRGFIGRW
jgi:hypothetical protein